MKISLFSLTFEWKRRIYYKIFIELNQTVFESKGYRDIMYYVCTPVYLRCRTNRHCVRSTKICNGLKNCMNKWNSSTDCIHLKRKLHTLSNDVNVVQNSPATFIGLFFTAFLFLPNLLNIRVDTGYKNRLISLFFIFFMIFYLSEKFVSTKKHVLV